MLNNINITPQKVNIQTNQNYSVQKEEKVIITNQVVNQQVITNQVTTNVKPQEIKNYQSHVSYSESNINQGKQIVQYNQNLNSLPKQTIVEAKNDVQYYNNAVPVVNMQASYAPSNKAETFVLGRQLIKEERHYNFGGFSYNQNEVPARPPMVQNHPPMVQNQPAQEPKFSFTIVRPEFSSYSYSFFSAGKYTRSFLQNIYTSRYRLYSWEDFASIECQYHKELKEYILLENIDNNFQMYDLICKHCLMQLNQQRRGMGEIKTRLYDQFLIESQSTIKKFYSGELHINDKIDIEATSTLMRDNILILADELVYLAEVFHTEISSKLLLYSIKPEEYERVKQFIAESNLLGNTLRLDGVGNNLALKRKYIKLANLLAQFTSFSFFNNQNVSAKMKFYVETMIKLRSLIVLRINEWLRYLTGNFYEQLNYIEGSQIDKTYISNLEIEYVSTTNITSYETNVIVNQQISQIQTEWELKFKTILEQVKMEYEKKFAEYLLQIDLYKTEITQITNRYSIEINNYVNQINQNKTYILQLENQKNTHIHSQDNKQITNTFDKETIVEKIIEVPVERIVEKIKEVPVEVIKEVKVEIIKEVPVEVIKEVIVEKIKEIPVEVIKEVIVEKIKEIPVEVIKEVKVEIIKEVPVEVIKEVIIEKIKEVQVPFPTEKIVEIPVTVEVEKVVEKIIEMPIPFEVQVPVEVIVEKEVIKEIPIEIEKIVVKEIPVIVEKIVEKEVVVTVPGPERVIIKEVPIEIPIVQEIPSEEKIVYVDRIKEVTVEVPGPERIVYVDRIKEVKIEVPGPEKIVYVEKIKEVPAEKVTPNVVEVTKEIIKEVIKEVPGPEKIVYVDKIKEVQVEKIVPKVVEIIKEIVKEVPGPERIVYVDKVKEPEVQQNKIEVDVSIEEKYTSEITVLENKVKFMQSQFEMLVEQFKTFQVDYESILIELNNSISINESLKISLMELETSIEIFNSQVGGIDYALKQQLEILSRQSKKNIDYKSQKEVVKRVDGQLAMIKTKLERIQAKKLNQSTFLSQAKLIINGETSVIEGKIFQIKESQEINRNKSSYISKNEISKVDDAVNNMTISSGNTGATRVNNVTITSGNTGATGVSNVIISSNNTRTTGLSNAIVSSGNTKAAEVSNVTVISANSRTGVNHVTISPQSARGTGVQSDTKIETEASTTTSRKINDILNSKPTITTTSLLNNVSVITGTNSRPTISSAAATISRPTITSSSLSQSGTVSNGVNLGSISRPTITSTATETTMSYEEFKQKILKN